MPKELLTQLQKANKRLKGSRAKLEESFAQLTSIDNVKIATDAELNASTGSIERVSKRLAHCELCLEKTVSRSDLDLQSSEQLAKLRDDVNSLCDMIDNLKDQYISIEEAGGYKHYNNDSHHIVANNDQLSIDLASQHQNIDKKADHVLAIATTQDTGNNQYANLLSVVRNIEKDAGEAYGEISKIRKVSRGANTQIANIADELESTRTHLNEAQARAETILAKAQENKAKVDEILSNAQTTLTASNEVQTQLNQSHQLLEETQSSISEKRKTIDEIVHNQKQLLEELTQALESKQQTTNNLEKTMTELVQKITVESEDLIKQSKEALQLSTAKGLSEGFKNAASEVSNQLRNAQILVFVSIFLIFVSVIFAFFPNQLLIAMQTVFETSTTFAPAPVVAENVVGWDNLLLKISDFARRLAILLPSLMLYSFANRWAKSQEEQRELFLYKRAVAVALPSFKSEAPNFEQEMAAAAFSKLLYNPMEEKPDALSSAPKSGLLSRFIDRIVREAVNRVKAE